MRGCLALMMEPKKRKAKNMVLIYIYKKWRLYANEKTGFFEVWKDGRRNGLILTLTAAGAIATFKKLFER